MRSVVRICFAFCVVSFLALAANAQMTTLTGTLGNSMTPVTGVNAPTNQVTVSNIGGFTVGDTVLLIQMKGAQMNTSNTASFGDISDIGEAGNYEFATICEITGNTVTFDYQLTRTYDASDYVQMIQVPVYQNVNVIGTLTENFWDTNAGTGGVLVIWARGWVRLSGNISMNDRGFRGGWDLNSYAPTCDCNCGVSPPVYSDYYYPSGNCRASSKGESIVDSVAAREFGRGKQAAGGGGSNDHNAGGGGGGNYGGGGNGGTAINPSCFFGAYCQGQYPGVGGLALNTYINNGQNRIFMGSGGGSGHDNNTTGTPGVRGGGIVIIVADSLNGNGGTIMANGKSQLFASSGDGAGGGGGGGTILLDVQSYANNPLNLSVVGGKGGDNSWCCATTNCKGPGGGGGGGVIWTSGIGFPGSVVTTVTGGIAGTQTGAACTGNNQGATAGGAGAVLTGLTRQMGAVDFSGCNLLPVQFAWFEATQLSTQVRLDWATSSEFNSALFEVQRSADGQNFSTIGQLPGAGASETQREYDYMDAQPLSGTSWYRIRQVDYNGQFSFSEARRVEFDGQNFLIQNIFPNPVAGSMMEVELMLPEASNASVEIFDVSGKQMLTLSERYGQGMTRLRIEADQFSAGMYFLKVRVGDRVETRKFNVVD